MKGFVHSTESFGSVDGPGIRFLIFLQGCAMRCRYCHNPDTWTPRTGTLMSVDELLDKAERYRSYWRGEGGITVSGGEPLLQMDFLTALFEEAHRRGISTCLDTSAQPFLHNDEWLARFDKLLDHTDLILLDLKHIDSQSHRSLTGHPNDNILDCARYLSDKNKPIWIRHVLVPGITSDNTLLHRLSDFIHSLNNVERIDVLPYHSMAISKYQKLGIAYSLEGVPSPTAEEVQHARNILCKSDCSSSSRH